MASLLFSWWGHYLRWIPVFTGMTAGDISFVLRLSKDKREMLARFDRLVWTRDSAHRERFGFTTNRWCLSQTGAFPCDEKTCWFLPDLTCLSERWHGYRRAVSVCSRRELLILTAGYIESLCYSPQLQMKIPSWNRVSKNGKNWAIGGGCHVAAPVRI